MQKSTSECSMCWTLKQKGPSVSAGISWPSFKPTVWSLISEWKHTFWWLLPEGWLTVSWSSNHLKVFLDCDREFSVLKWAPKSQDLSPVEHFLGTDLHHGSADICSKLCVMMWCHHVDIKQTLRNVFSSLLNRCHRELTPSQVGTSEVSLMKSAVQQNIDLSLSIINIFVHQKLRKYSTLNRLKAMTAKWNQGNCV